MARPLHIEFPGALYYVTARGDQHEKATWSPESTRTQRRQVLTIAFGPQV